MFQDLNRKLHHAEKDRESPASDTKVTHLDKLLISHFHRFLSRKCIAKKKKMKRKSSNWRIIAEAILMCGEKKIKSKQSVRISLVAITWRSFE